MSDQHTKTELPVLTSKSQILYPGGKLPFRAKRKHTRSIIALAKSQYQSLLIFSGEEQKKAKKDSLKYFKIATLAQVIPAKTNSTEVSIIGLKRVLLDESGSVDKAGIYFTTYETLEDKDDLDSHLKDNLTSQIKSLGKQVLEIVPADTGDFEKSIRQASSLNELIYLIAEHLDGKLHEKQEVLETISLRERGLLILARLQRAKESLSLQNEIRDRLSVKMTKMQREGILREHMRAIQDELGEGDQQTKLRRKIEESAMPHEIKESALDELQRLESMGRISPEAHVIQNYLETLAALPWHAPEKVKVDLQLARSILDEDHYGLEKVKKRILEYLAVLHLKKGPTGNILLLAGPPGVGKTSLVKSIAKSLERPYVRVSLGGVKDDAEIRGHRRTYIGAMPGQIIEGLKRAKARNPVFLLDELDKLGHSNLGSPAHALLEVLDPEQNHSFMDHFIDQPFDLSDVIFVATANELRDIPAPLRDRMETIELTGYTPLEKLQIAKDHLVPTKIADHGIKKSDFIIHKPGLDFLISHYTREAGVRDLQRQISGLARHVAADKVMATATRTLTPKKIRSILGAEIFDHDEASEGLPPGVATGLAWTPVGGEILKIEVKVLPGRGKLLLTGKLGDVMKESAQIALSLVRSYYPSLSPDLCKNDVHIHVPSGATPKDGPSAGITLACALLSSFSNKKVDEKLAMSAEISLRGRVLPVGGVKEKLIGAHRAGITKIILSDRNKKDIEDLPKEVSTELRINFVSTIEEVFSKVFGFIDVTTFHPHPEQMSHQSMTN